MTFKKCKCAEYGWCCVCEDDDEKPALNHPSYQIGDEMVPRQDTPQIIAIVGCSKVWLDRRFKAQMRKLISSFDRHTTVISGGARGTDTLAIQTAAALGHEVEVFFPDSQTWPDFKIRNLLIADKADKIYSFAAKLALGGTPCYHCRNAGKDTNHQVTGGCYTGHANGNYEVIIIGSE